MVESSIVPPPNPQIFGETSSDERDSHWLPRCQNKTKEKLIGGCYELLELFKQQKLSKGTPPLSCFALDNNINAGLVPAPGAERRWADWRPCFA